MSSRERGYVGGRRLSNSEYTCPYSRSAFSGYQLLRKKSHFYFEVSTDCVIFAIEKQTTFIMIEPISLVTKYNCGESLYIETFSLGYKPSNRIFRIIIITENGYPCGYNTNCHLQTWSLTGWIEIADNKQAGITTYNGDHYASPEKKQEMSERTAEEFKKYAETFFSFL